jgi:hypothetical protein
MSTSRILFAIAILTAVGSSAKAQPCQPSWPVRFIPVDVTAPAQVPSVVSSAAYDDGLGGPAMLYIAGSFNAVGGVAAHNFARWDGRTWSAPAGATLETFSNSAPSRPSSTFSISRASSRSSPPGAPSAALRAPPFFRPLLPPASGRLAGRRA